MVKKPPGSYWSDEEIKQAIEEWRQKRPEKLKSGEWRVEDIPFYEQGRPVRADLWHRVDYLEEYDFTYGKKWGASGLGRLREAAVVRPTEADLHIFARQDPGFIISISKYAILEKWQKEHDDMVQIMRDNGVTVHYIEYPEPKVGAYGPLRSMWAGGEAAIVWGGALVARFGWAPLSKGREKVTTEFLVKQGCPILLTVIGKGVLETGTMQFLADDCALIGRGVAFNQEGIDQVIPVLRRVGITEIVEVPIASWVESNKWPIAGTYHPDMFMRPLDLGKILIYPGVCGWDAIKWFRDHKFELIEIDADEQKEFLPSNLLVLEPGKVMMHAGAKRTIEKVRKAGVEVIEVPYKENITMGGGISCCVLRMVRDRGPKLADIK
ncbi:MAG: hypothetical protein HYX91_04625 [Chloroflexi bacterium]|nr:hypothetical protein [Chloroflexota bacterium]